MIGPMFRHIALACSLSLILCAHAALVAQTQAPSTTVPPHPARPAPPTRDPDTPGYVKATVLPDGAVPPANVDGNFILGPTHNPAPEVSAQPSVPQGAISSFIMNSADSKFYPGIAREPGTSARPIRTTPRSSSSLRVTPRPIRAASRFTSRSNMSPARLRPSSLAPTALIPRSSPLSTA